MNASRLGAGVVAIFVVVAVASAWGQQTALTKIQEEVRGREAAFARTMADRNLAAFTLALTSGPAFDPQGQRIGTFNSTWRRDADLVWRIIFDKGC